MKIMEGFINFWVNGILTCLVVVGGIFLNSISIYIIWKKYNKSSIFYQMLLRLLCIDIFVLVTWFTFSLYVAFKVEHKVMLYIIAYIIYPFVHVALSASTFMTIAISHERYLAVKYPIKYTEDMRVPHVLTRRLWTYTITVILVSVIYNLTYFLEVKVTFGTISNNTAIELQSRINVTQADVMGNIKHQTIFSDDSSSDYVIFLDRTTLGKNEDYLKYYMFVTRLIISGIVPFVLLTYFNIEIFRAIKKNNRLRRRLTLSQPLSRLMSVQSAGCESLDSGFSNVTNSLSTASSIASRKRQEEDNLAMVFVVMVVAFLFCNSLKFGLNFYDGIVGKDKAEEWYRIISSFSNLLVLINSSMNMVIYCILNMKFRRHLIELMKGFIPGEKVHKSSRRSIQTNGSMR